MKRVVVVDDEPSVGAAVRDLLVPEGFQVDTPADPQTALPELLRAVPDLVPAHPQRGLDGAVHVHRPSRVFVAAARTVFLG